MAGTAKMRGKPSGLAHGRPSSYRPGYVDIVARMVGAGATEGEVATRLDCAAVTLWRWRAEHPEFAAAFKFGKEAAADRIVGAMFHRAVGYTFDSEKIVVVDKKVERVPIKEHVLPDVGAGTFMLTNLRPQEWRNRQQVEMGGPGDFDRMTDDELRRFIDAEAAIDVTPAAPKLKERSSERTGIAPARRKASDLFG